MTSGSLSRYTYLQNDLNNHRSNFKSGSVLYILGYVLWQVCLYFSKHRQSLQPCQVTLENALYEQVTGSKFNNQ